LVVIQKSHVLVMRPFCTTRNGLIESMWQKSVATYCY